MHFFADIVFIKVNHATTEAEVHKTMRLWIAWPGDTVRNAQAKLARLQRKRQELAQRRADRLARVEAMDN